MLTGTRAGLSWWCRLFDIGIFLILLGAALQFVDANEWECGKQWCYKLSNTAANQSAANKTCSNQGTSLANVTLESNWKSFLAFTDKKTKTEPEYSRILWSSLVVKRLDGVTEILYPATDLQNGSCEAKVCQDFLGSVTRDGVWCAVLNIGKTTTLSAEDCKAEHSFVCQKPVGEEEAYRIMGLNIELFAAFIVLLYLFIVFVISIIWGTYIENKKAEEYAVINREYYAKSKKSKKHEVKPIVVMESNA